MKKYVLPVVLIISLILNMVLLCKMCHKVNDNSAAKATNEFEYREYRTATAQNLLKILYVKISISLNHMIRYLRRSVFHDPLTDSECLKAASELIKFKSELPSSERSYKEAVHTLKNFGSPGVFWRNAEEKKEAEDNLNSLKSKIAKREEIIKQRDTLEDSKFIGWQVVHRYRARTRGGEIKYIRCLIYTHIYSIRK